VRVLIVGLLVLSGLLFDPSFAMAASSIVRTQSTALAVVAQQQPVSTIPPLPQGPPRFSTIPPLPNTPTPVRLVSTPTTVPTQVPVSSPLPTRAAPAGPGAPQVPARPAAQSVPAQSVPAQSVPSQSAPRAGGFPLEVALLVFTGSATALGGGLYLFRRSRSR
jgi:hypothetical protein